MLNTIILQGRFTADVEIKKTQSGLSVASFTLAVDRGGGRDTDFVRCVAWRGTADFIGKYPRKGTLAVVSGSLHSREWEKDGTKRTEWEVTVNEFYPCEKKKEAKLEEIAEDGELPF